MDEKAFKKPFPGKLVPTDLTGYKVAFLPDPLPPDWKWPVRLWELLKDASVSLSRLDGIGLHMENPDLLLRPMQRREALKSSSLEGTFVSAEELLLFEIQETGSAAGAERLEAWREVHNYTEALKIWDEAKKKLPVSRRVICKLHDVLMADVRGGSKLPGQFRKSSVQIGKPARYIPPPAQYISDCIGELEKYMNGDRALDGLVDAFIVHYQFEAIHPFLDGNGRVGRLLLAILVQEWCKLSGPWLYMSEYFEENKSEYVDRLFAISAKGDWEGWVEFCLKGVVVQANETSERCARIVELKREYRQLVRGLDHGNARLTNIMDDLFDNPIIRIARLARIHGVTYPTAKADVQKLEDAKVLRPLADSRPAAFYAPEIFKVAYAD